MSSLVCLSYYSRKEKQNVTNIEKKEKERYRHVVERERKSFDTVTYKKEEDRAEENEPNYGLY